jgi:hypothetical protein
MEVLGAMLILSGLFELHCGLNWKYFDRSIADVERIKESDFDPKTDELKCGGYIVQNVFEFIAMIVAAFVAFTATLPYLLPIWILSFLPRRWKKKNRWWQVTDNFVCAALFFAAAMLVLIGTTENMRVG